MAPYECGILPDAVFERQPNRPAKTIIDNSRADHTEYLSPNRLVTDMPQAPNSQ